MAVNLTYEEQTSNIDETLLYAQIIAEAFTKALDSNECNVKLLIGFAEEVEREKQNLEDIISLVEDPLRVVDDTKVSDVGSPSIRDTYVEPTPSEIIAENIAAVSRKLKDSCIDCKFAFPSLDLNYNFNFAFDRLKAMINLYYDAIKKLTNPNLCHVAGAFSYACIPSIITLIMLLVSAYAAILAAKQLGGFSLDAFIQGIIMGLLGQILASFSIRIDTSKTGIACLIEAIKEIANDIASQASEISGAVPTEILEQLGYSPKIETPEYITEPNPEAYETEEDLLVAQQQYLEEKAAFEASYVNVENEVWSYETFLETYASMSGQEKSIVDKYLSRIESENNNLNENISNAFGEVSQVVEKVQKSLNEDLANMFGLLDYFQCEAERSGAGFTDILEYVNKLTTVINLLSAIIAMIAKKQIKKLCKTKASMTEMLTVLEDVPLGEPLTELEQVELLEEFLEKVVELTTDENNELVPLIYNKDKEPLLPKLSLTNCNLKDFIEGHKLENIIDTVLEDIRNEEALEEERTSRTPIGTKPKGKVQVGSEYVLDRKKWELYPLKFEKPKFTTTRFESVPKDLLTNDPSSEAGLSAGIQSILDLIYNNPLDNNKNVNKTESQSPNTSTPTDTNDIKNKEFRDFIKSPLSVDSAQKKAFQNKCKDIDDVLNILGSINK